MASNLFPVSPKRHGRSAAPPPLRGRPICPLSFDDVHVVCSQRVEFCLDGLPVGAFDQILFIEEPLTEQNEENVADIGGRIAAGESAHDYEGAVRRLERGYRALVLKRIAKTLSLSMKMAQYAHQKKVPCLCADLTVNPVLVDWHKNLAARLAPFPGLDMGLLETNGNLNYRNWKTMQSFHPAKGASWSTIKDSVFNLVNEFYEQSGGILKPIAHYEQMFSKS